MQRVKYDLEILYVQKIYFFLFLLTFTALASMLISLKLSWDKGLIAFFLGFICSYIAMIRKKDFAPPEKTATAKRMAREISQDTSPLAIARFASQLYFYFHEPKKAISILEKYIPSQDPLLCATLGDILLREGRPKQALSILRDNPYALTNPLLLATQGHVLQQMNRTSEAIKIYERSLRLASEAGFPHNGAIRFTQILLTLSYTASIHHSLADCYALTGDFPNAKRHYMLGNIRLIDLTMWRTLKAFLGSSPKNYTKSH
ncbi:MAG: tetratricopeptide repeat protein [Desulfitobacterium hafniense]|nr:tetratricopeptide repeat protein [Desulfitobacterium hafniense]